MKTLKRILSALVFLCILAFLVDTTGRFLRPTSRDFEFVDQYYKESSDSVDVVFTGSSSVYRFWSPPQAYEEQGFTSYMMAAAGVPFAVAPYLMEEAVKTQDVKLFVVEMRHLLTERSWHTLGTSEQKEAESTYRLSSVVSGMKPSINKWQLTSDLLQEDEENTKLLWMFPLVKYHDNLTDGWSSLLLKRLLGYKNPLKGARLTARVQAQTPMDDDEELPVFLEAEDYALIDQVAEKAEKLGVPLLFLSTPYVIGPKRSAMQKQLQEYMDEKGYAYLNMCDLTDEIGLDYAVDFYDASHTNVVGAQKVTSYLARYIKEHYNVTASLTKAQQKDWEKAVKALHKKVKKLEKKWRANVAKAQ